MTRELRVVPAGPEVLEALRAALAGGPAILVRPSGAPPAEAGRSPELPREVPQKVALVVETSGSTGRPKRVAISADALLANAAAGQAALAAGSPGAWVLALPTHYIAGLNVLARSIAAGIDPAVVAPGPFTASAFVRAAARVAEPHPLVSLVPAQLATLLGDEPARAALSGFGAVLVGGQATPAALLDAAREAGIHVVRSYGSSETSGGCVYDGEPIGTTRMRVVDGEVQLGGPGIAEGYLGDPALSGERFLEEDGVRWFRTADAGSVDADGRLRVTGRRDDVIVSGGLKVALGDIERVAREEPRLVDAVAVAVPHPRWGERAVLVTAAPEDAELGGRLDARLAAELGPAARPLRIVWGTGIPTLASGKPDRLALHRLALDG
ncbi:AMP-binding protein [Homoserinibacter sp. YIM 151385]|uniref:AMP-binding protein n=1 Tax=Homoserinibacter sp. YIM 151385 TaxID=2985506 RepID=UPI0022F0447C|nr:AMP-binding protein [Homoserinibacter sp. YIM 151385]WBU37004.1 AMP-binding protein [Homoserinibacter sp. YIM 151385]